LGGRKTVCGAKGKGKKRVVQMILKEVVRLTKKQRKSFTKKGERE